MLRIVIILQVIFCSLVCDLTMMTPDPSLTGELTLSLKNVNASVPNYSNRTSIVLKHKVFCEQFFVAIVVWSLFLSFCFYFSDPSTEYVK